MTDITSMVLKLIGGNPLNKVKKVIANMLPVTTSMDLDGLQGLMSKLMSGSGLGSIFQNPLSSVLGQLQGAIPNISQALSGLEGMTGSLSQILNGAGGLSSALSSLEGMTNALSGVTHAVDGAFGMMDVISHATSLEGLVGAVLPQGVGMDSVLAPLNLVSHLEQNVLGLVNSLPDQIANGLLESEAVALVQSHIDTINAAMTASHTALTTLHDLTPHMATVSYAASAMINGPASIQSHLTACLQPSSLDVIQAAVVDHMTSIGGGEGAVIDEVETI